jgi:hypothetical protein
MVRTPNDARVSALCMITAGLLVGTAACQPEFNERTSLVADARILAVRSDPAEGPPGTMVSYSALVGDVSGTNTSLDIQWDFCTLPKPVSELNDVSTRCFSPDEDILEHFESTGVAVAHAIPTMPNACNQFGPDVPDTKPPGRPADPDATGGFYQPLRLLVNRGDHYDLTLAETRIACHLPGATSEVVRDYNQRYRLNENPEVKALTATSPSLARVVDLKPESEGDSGLAVPRGATVRLAASWDSCPIEPACGNGFCEGREVPDKDTADRTGQVFCAEDCTMPKGCSGAEAYVSFDLSTRLLGARREAMRVSWYANGGALTDDRTGRSEEEASLTSSENTWTAPAQAGTVTLWVVIRDSRGGLNWKAYRVTVQ